MKGLRKLFLGLVKSYQWISPLWQWFMRAHGAPCQCKFAVSCSEYAVFELKTNPQLHHALGRIAFRLWNCSPWGKSIN